MEKAKSLLDHLSEKSTPDSAWEEYLQLRPAKRSDWLTGDPCRLDTMLRGDLVSQQLAELLTQQLGPGIWQHTQNDRTLLGEALDRHILWQSKGGSTHIMPRNAGVIAALVKLLPEGTMKSAIDQALVAIPLSRRSSLVLPVPLNEQDRLAEAHALLELRYAAGALICGDRNPNLHEPDDQGRNLAWLLAQTKDGQTAWIKHRKPLDAPVWIDPQGQRLDEPMAWAAWLNKAGFFHAETKSWVRKHQAEDDPLFEEQLRGKHWRGAITRRANWREWTNGRGANALHVLALHHSASFLTSQSRVQANHDLLGRLDHQGHDTMSYLLLGMAQQAPDQGKRSYWVNARNQFNETSKSIDRSRQEQGLGEPTRGSLRLMVDQPEMVRRIYPKTFANLGSEARRWMESHPDRVWAGMDAETAFTLMRHPKVYSDAEPFWTLAVRQALTQGFPVCVPSETQVVILALSLSQGNTHWPDARATEALNGPLSLPDDIIERIVQRISKQEGHTQEMIKSRLRRLGLEALMPGETTPHDRRQKM